MKRNDKGYRIGECHHNAKVSDADVELIRQLTDEGLKPRHIAEKFDIPRGTLDDIIYYRYRTGVTHV